MRDLKDLPPCYRSNLYLILFMELEEAADTLTFTSQRVGGKVNLKSKLEIIPANKTEIQPVLLKCFHLV